jgi:hypothetical protein
VHESAGNWLSRGCRDGSCNAAGGSCCWDEAYSYVVIRPAKVRNPDSQWELMICCGPGTAQCWKTLAGGNLWCSATLVYKERNDPRLQLLGVQACTAEAAQCPFHAKLAAHLVVSQVVGDRPSDCSQCQIVRRVSHCRASDAVHVANCRARISLHRAPKNFSHAPWSSHSCNIELMFQSKAVPMFGMYILAVAC